MRDNFFLDSTYYKILSAEHEEINKLKWIESEKKGYDIGKSKAVFLWLHFHRKKWIEEFLKKLNEGE